MDIRPESREDAAAISAVTQAAFKGVPFSDQTEAAIIDALRRDNALSVSLVAILDGALIGHIAFSPVTVSGASGPWYGLGPVSVAPDQQRKGVGGALIRAGLQALKGLMAKGCVVLGDPPYYHRFGFRHDPALFYAHAPPEYFQRVVFDGPPPVGGVTYHPGFEAQ